MLNLGSHAVLSKGSPSRFVRFEIPASKGFVSGVLDYHLAARVGGTFPERIRESEGGELVPIPVAFANLEDGLSVSPAINPRATTEDELAVFHPDLDPIRLAPLVFTQRQAHPNARCNHREAHHCEKEDFEAIPDFSGEVLALH